MSTILLLATLTQLSSGTSGAVFAPDGKRVVFEQQVGWDRHLGIADFESGEVKWIEQGPGMAGMASWGADGSIVYVAGAITNTAFESYVKKITDGYGLRIWKDGEKRDFLNGRRRDATPSFSPDMQTIYWATSEGNAEHRLGQDFLFAAPVNDVSKRKRIFFNQYKHIDAAANQPQVSPNGKYLLWAQLDCIQDRWSIRCAFLDNPDRNYVMTKKDLIAFEPRWSADGEYIVYTGFREGDGGWCCYIQQVSTGWEKRLCCGREPSLSPDGKYLAYTDDEAKCVKFRKMTTWDYPIGHRGHIQSVMVDAAALRDEKVVFTTGECGGLGQTALPAEAAFPDKSETVFMRAEIEWSGDSAKTFQRVLWAKYGPASHEGINFIFYMGAPTLAICDAHDSDLLDRDMPEQTKMQIEYPTGLKAGVYTITGIRSENLTYLSVNGSEPLQRVPRWELTDLSHPEKLVFAEELGGSAKVRKVELGTGWPRNVPKPLRRIDLWPREGAVKRSVDEVKSAAFEKVALIDSFDFALILDCETKAGTRQIVDYAIDECGCSALWWRPQGGGVPRYDSKEEMARYHVSPFVKQVQFGGDNIYGWVNLAKGELMDEAFKAIAERGAGGGVHLTWEENHHQSASCNYWNLMHPEYSCQMIDGMARPGYTSSLAYDEVLEHKLKRLDELIAMGANTLYLDMWRQGGWYAYVEFTPKMLQEWKKLYGTEKPASTTDERWVKLVAEWTVNRYFRAIRKRLDNCGRKVEFMIGLPYMDTADRGVWERYALDWKMLAEEGVFDGIVISGVVADRKRAFESTAEIYQYVMDHKGKAKKVYFPCAAYNFYNNGLLFYHGATGLKMSECAEKLLTLAKDAGANGVVLECVDYDNYDDATRAVLRNFK